MAQKRTASEAIELQASSSDARRFETPEKVPRRDAGLNEASLLRVQQEVPDFAGLLAEYLWHEEDESQARRQQVSIRDLLLTGRSAQLQFIVGMKEGRLRERPPMEDRSYAIMCDHLNALFPVAWNASRQLRFTSTLEADRKFVKSVLSAW